MATVTTAAAGDVKGDGATDEGDAKGDGQFNDMPDREADTVPSRNASPRKPPRVEDETRLLPEESFVGNKEVDAQEAAAEAAAAAAAAADAKDWKCDACTWVNLAKTSKCAMCATACHEVRVVDNKEEGFGGNKEVDAQEAAAKAAAAAAAAAAADAKNWKCDAYNLFEESEEEPTSEEAAEKLVAEELAADQEKAAALPAAEKAVAEKLVAEELAANPFAAKKAEQDRAAEDAKDAELAAIREKARAAIAATRERAGAGFFRHATLASQKTSDGLTFHAAIAAIRERAGAAAAAAEKDVHRYDWFKLCDGPGKCHVTDVDHYCVSGDPGRCTTGHTRHDCQKAKRQRQRWFHVASGYLPGSLKICQPCKPHSSSSSSKRKVTSSVKKTDEVPTLSRISRISLFVTIETENGFLGCKERSSSLSLAVPLSILSLSLSLSICADYILILYT